MVATRNNAQLHVQAWLNNSCVRCARLKLTDVVENGVQGAQVACLLVQARTDGDLPIAQRSDRAGEQSAKYKARRGLDHAID